MISRWQLVALLCAGSLLAQVAAASAQLSDPTFGDVIAGSARDAIEGAQIARANMAAFNQDIAAARRKYRQCEGTCADRSEVATQLDGLLRSKDYHYAIMEFLETGMKGLGGDAHVELTRMVLGPLDGGIPAYASPTFGQWVRCLKRGKQAGLFVKTPDADAFTSCEAVYRIHRQRRNLWEYFERPGVREALLAANASAAGAPLMKEERAAFASGVLPDKAGAAEVLECVYGPIGPEGDSVLAPFKFWYGRVPLSHADLLAEFNGPMDGPPDYLRIPEVARETCPPGELNALAIYKSQVDSEEFLAVKRKKLQEEQERKAEAQHRAAVAEQERRGKDAEHRRKVESGRSDLREIFEEEVEACRREHPATPLLDRERCVGGARMRYERALKDALASSEDSPFMPHTANTIGAIGKLQGGVDACLDSHDTATRVSAEGLARRGFPDSTDRLMELYDFHYDESRRHRTVYKEKYAKSGQEFEQCSEKMLARQTRSVKVQFGYLEKSIGNVERKRSQQR